MIRCTFIIIYHILLFTSVKGQFKLGPFLRYTDFHIHPTYKHYFRYETADTMQLLLRYTSYDRENDVITYNGPDAFRDAIKNVNWTKYEMPKTKYAIANGITANLRNYDQSGYPEIMYVPGSILCNSYSPYEKQFALKKFKRLISHYVVTKMGLPRLTTYAEDSHTPFKDFLAEYFYNFLQEEEKFIQTSSPDTLYVQDGNYYHENIGYYNKIKMVKDSRELTAIVKHNDDLFKNWKPGDGPPHIITPMVMSIEGAQVLYDTLSAKRQYILNPLNFDEGTEEQQEEFTPADPETLKKIHEELLSVVDKLKNLHHRLFFITLGHFAQNHVVGFAKTLDRDPENLEHRAIATLTKFPKQRNDVLRKTYAGFNPGIDLSNPDWVPDSIGLKVVEAFLNPDSSVTRFQKPTYIDVKHMDIKARIQYYYMRRKYEKLFKVSIPIIASHFGVSGEGQAMAAATGLWPNFDRYNEIENIRRYYYTDIVLKYKKKKRAWYWGSGVMDGQAYANSADPNYANRRILDSFERAMYTPLDFTTDTIFDNRLYDPFKNYKVDKSKAGWYYPWSINLFDEEIVEINKSDGIIGILLDPRQLGAFMPNYKNIKKKLGKKFEYWKSKVLDDAASLLPYDFRIGEGEINAIEYFKAEPLIRNIFYIVQVIKNRKLQEDFYKATGNDVCKTRERYPEYIQDLIFTEKDPWKMVAIGGDFDGLIDPLDLSPTASYIPLLRKRMVIYAYIFAQIHHLEFTDPLTGSPYIQTLAESYQKMEQFFYSNGRDFILKYF